MEETELLHLLKWKTNYPPILNDLSKYHHYYLSRLFNQICWIVEYQEPEVFQALKVILNEVNNEEVDEFLSSPIVYTLMNNYISSKNKEDLEELLKQFSQWFVVEKGGYLEVEQGTYWSPNCSSYRIITVDGVSQKYSSESIDGLILDFNSPLATRIDMQSGVMSLPPEEFNEEEKTLIVEKISKALDIIKSTSLVTYKLIRNYTRIIHIRKSSQNPYISSEQVPKEIGAIRLLNVQMDSFSLIEVVDMLIHESIHNLLSIYENKNSCFVEGGDDLHFRPISPWSGNAIPQHSMTHAIPIYFAIFNFMRLLNSDDNTEVEISREDVNEKFFKCASGFSYSPNILEYLSFTGKIRPEACNVYSKMQAYVNDCLQNDGLRVRYD